MAFRKLVSTKGVRSTVILRVSRRSGFGNGRASEISEPANTMKRGSSSSHFMDIEDPEMREVIQRIIALARLDESKLLDIMSSEEGAEGVLGMELRGLDPDSADLSLQSWDEIQAASSQPLDETQYQRFLRGLEDAVNVDAEPYGPHAEHAE